MQEESLKSGVRANPRSRRITQQWGSGQSPFKRNHSTTGFGTEQWGSANPRSRRITQQWGSGQSPFKKNHSTVGFGPISIQEEPVNNGVRPSPFKKNHSTVGFGPIPVLEESLNNGVRAVPPSRRTAQQEQDNSLGWYQMTLNLIW